MAAVALDLGGGPRIGLGLAAVGRPGYINLGHAADFEDGRDVDAMRAHAHRLLDAALEAGIRYFDAARSYGRAEEFLGSWLTSRRLRSGDVAVGSKWGYRYTAGWSVQAQVHEVKELTLANFERQRDETLALLGPWLRLYQIHSATLESGVLDDQGLLGALAAFRASTGIALGLSVSGPHQAQTVRRALELGLFDAVQATWNPLEVSAAGALRAAHDAGLKVIVKEAVANGRLTARGSGPVVDLLERAGAGAGAEADAVALSVALAQPWADLVLSGASTVAMLRSNLASLSLHPSDELLASLSSVAIAPEDYWAQRAALPWN